MANISSSLLAVRAPHFVQAKKPFRALRRWADGLAAACLALLPVAAQAAPFTTGNVVVQQADDGTKQNTTISLVEISTTGASQPVQTISLPGTTTPNALRINGSGGTSGYLATTNDGALLCVTAANAQNAGDLGQTSAASITTRSVVTFNSDGVYALPTAGYTGTSGNQTRTSSSADNSNWVIGDNAGIYLSNAETTPSTAAATGTNLLGVSTFGGTVYAMSATGIFTVSTNFSNNTATLTALPGVTGLTKLTGFCLIKSGNSGSTYDVLYAVSDNSATAATIFKYFWTGSTWSAKSSYTTNFGGLGVAAKANGSGGGYTGATLYMTSGNGATVANKVNQLIDATAYNANISSSPTISTLYTFSGNNLGKGIAFVPTGPSISTVGAVSAVSTVSGTASSATSFTVIASGLTGNLTVTPPAGFEVSSTSATSGFGATATLTPSSGTVAATTIYVRLAAADSAANYSGNITCSSSGATSVTMAMPSSTVAAATITLTGTPSAVSTTYGTASTATSFNASGSGLSGNLTVTPPAGFEVSSTSATSGFASTATLTPSGGTLASTPVYVRLTASATVSGSPYSGNVSVSGGGAVTQTKAIPASTVSPLALTINPVSVTTKPWDGTTAATITGALVGVVPGDTVTLVGTGTFASSNDGSGIAVTSTSTLSGTSASNYTLTQPTGLTGTIQPSANLGNLVLGTGVLSPVFAFNTTSYSATVPSTQTSINLTPTTDAGAAVTVNGVASTGTVNLVPGTNTFTIVVTNNNGSPPTQTYTVTITVPTPFTLGNLAFESIGDSTATPITILEIDPIDANQTPVNSYPVPSTGSSALRQSNAGTTARLGTTNDGTLLAFTGFEDSTGILNGAPVTDETAIALRGVATLDRNYNYTLQASYNVSSQATPLGDQIRTATSLDNTNWIMDDKVGIYKNNSTNAANATYGNTTNCVVVKSFGGTIYALSQKTNAALSTLSSDGVTLTGLPGLVLDANAVDYYLIASGVHGSTYDLLYILDGATISKFSLVSGTWTQNGNATSIGGATGVGMCAVSNGTGANLYVTTGTGLTVLEITDSAGYNAPPSINTSNNVTLYTAPSGQFLKGVAFAPVSSPLPDLTIAVSSPFIAGNSFAYTLTLANSGAAAASGVTAQFTLPTGISYSSYSYSGSNGFSVSPSGGVVSISGGTLAAGASDTITINVTGANGSYTVDAGSTPQTGHGSAVINTSATTASPIAESNSANNYPNVADPTIVGTVPYLSVNVGGAATVVANGNYNYTLTAQNTGTGTANGVNIAITLPAGLAYVSATDSSNGADGFSYSYNSGTGVLTISGGTLAAGASDNITVTVTAVTSAYRINTEYINAGAAVITGSNFTGGNASTASVTTSVTLPAGPDLVIACTPNGPFQANDAADTFNIYVTNNGTAATDGSTVAVTEVLPSGLTPAASMNGATINGWTLAVSSQTVTATRSDVLQPGAEYPAVASGPNIYSTLPITFSVGSGVSGSLSATATVAGGGDVFSLDNSVTNTITVGTPTAISSSGYLLVSRGHYLPSAVNITPGVTVLPNGAVATVSGAYPQIWSNEEPDVSFGVTAPIYLDVVDKYSGNVTSTTNLTSLIQTQLGIAATTSFSSKSELGITLTPDSKGVTTMGYVAPAGTLDVSNANTPYHDDPTSPLAGHGDFQHCGIQVDYQGNVQVTPTDSNSGDNTRTMLLAQAGDGHSYYYFAGSAGNSGSGVTGTTTTMLAQATGLQMVLPGAGGITTPVGQPFQNGTAASPPFANSTKGFQLGYAGLTTDKTGKDMNLRGLTLNPFNNTLYASKGSGGSGVDTLYQIGSGGLPTAANASTQAFTIPPGFPTTSGNMYPFAMWFANATTLYVCDEGEVPPAPPTFSNGSGGGYAGGYYPEAQTGNSGGLQKWVFNGTQWTLAYTLTQGLNLGTPYPNAISGYPTPGTVNPSTGVPWQPANNGLRTMAGQVNGDGTVTIFAVTSTVSGDGDQGADPNQLVAITDSLSATSLPANESFTLLETASGLDCLRGVALAPAVPAPDLWASATHTGTFTQGDTADTCTLNVSNSGNATTNGTVTVTDTFPAGLTPAASMNGTTVNGWSVSVSGQMVTATRTDSITAGTGYPSLPITVAVEGDATASVTNNVTVSGGGEVYTANDTAADAITLALGPANTWRLAHLGTPLDTGSAADGASFTNDGISNLMTYAFGLDPTVSVGQTALTTLVSGSANPLLSDRLAINFTLPLPTPTDIVYTVQATGDLVNWTTVATKTGSGAWTWSGGGSSHIVETDGTNTSSLQIGDNVPMSGQPQRTMILRVLRP